MYNLWHNQLKSYCAYFVSQTYPVWPLMKRFWVLRNLTLGGGTHFKLVESFVVVERWCCRCPFCLLKLINRHFSRESHKKFFQYLFSKSLNCLYNFVVAVGILHPKSCVLFPIFFFAALLPLSYGQGKFRTSSAIRSSEAAAGGVL